MARPQRTFFSAHFIVIGLWCLVGFFFIFSLYGLISGDRSLLAWLDLRQQNKQIQNQINGLTASKEKLEALTERLHPLTLNKDYTEQLIRQQLPYGQAGDVIIFLPEVSDTNNNSTRP